MANKVIKEIKVDENVMGRLEKLHYEVESRKSIISNMVASGMANGAGFEKYASEYGELFKDYTALKTTITNDCVPSEYRTDNHSWNANFEKKVIEIIG